jgi:hypothetical protein
LVDPGEAYRTDTAQFGIAQEVAQRLGVGAPVGMPMARQPDNQSCGDHVLAGMEVLAHRVVNGQFFTDGGLDLGILRPDRRRTLQVLTRHEPHGVPNALPQVPSGVQLPGEADPVWNADGTMNVQETGRAQTQVLLPSIALLMGTADPDAMLAQLQAMPPAGVYQLLQQHAVASFRAYAQQGGQAPDLATVEAVLMRLQNAQLAAAPHLPALGMAQAEPSDFLAGLTGLVNEGLATRQLGAFFKKGSAEGAGNVCLFDTIYQLAQRAGQEDRLQAFTAGAQGDEGRAEFAQRMQALLASTGLLAQLGHGGYDQFELQGGSFAAHLLADIAGLRLTVLSSHGGTVQLGATAGNAGPEAFIFRKGGRDGHFEPMWPRQRQ